MGAPTGLRLGSSTRSMQQAVMPRAAEKGLTEWITALTQRMNMMQAKTTSALPA